MKKGIYIKGIALLLLITVFFCTQMFWDVRVLFSPGRIQEWLIQAGWYAPILYMFIMALAVVVSPIPSLPLDIAAGIVFGPYWGTLYSVIGALAGAVLSFSIARYLGRDFIEGLIGGHINFCSTCSDRILTKVVFLSRLIPVISFDIVSYGAGLTKMSLRNFSLATCVGMIPLTFIYNYFGSVMVFNTGLTYGIALLLVVFLFVLPGWLEKKDFMKIMKHE